jgi:ribosomal protein S18 acetylase RimI-like enzyme
VSGVAGTDDAPGDGAEGLGAQDLGLRVAGHGDTDWILDAQARTAAVHFGDPTIVADIVPQWAEMTRQAIVRGEVMVVTVGGHAAGYFWDEARPGHRFIVDIHVAEEFRGRGVAGWLLDQIEARAVAAGIDEIRFVVADRNTAARSLFDRWRAEATGPPTAEGLREYLVRVRSGRDRG